MITTQRYSYTSVYLLHGKGGSPGGSVLQLEALLRQSFPEPRYERLSLPHGREKGGQAAERSVDFLRELLIEPGALLIGISLGGLVAAKLQETGREDLHVICISSPTWADGVELQRGAGEQFDRLLWSYTDRGQRGYMDLYGGRIREALILIIAHYCIC